MTKKMINAIIITIMVCMGINLCCCETYSATDTIDSVMQGAQNFIEKGAKEKSVNETNLKKASDLIFTMVLAISMVTAVIVGMIIGIQFMVASVEEKAKLKETLLPYVVGCVVAFGAIGIWKLAITVLSNWQ